MTKLHAAIHSFLSSLTISKYIYDHRLPHQTDYECGVLADEALRGETLNGTPSLVSFLRVIEEDRFLGVSVSRQRKELFEYNTASSTTDSVLTSPPMLNHPALRLLNSPPSQVRKKSRFGQKDSLSETT